MSEDSAARLLREVRWSGGVRCVYCGSYMLGLVWGVYRRYRCRVCLRTFNDKSVLISSILGYHLTRGFS